MKLSTARKKVNCWEVKNCGRGPGSGEGNICPAAKETRLDGVHGGVNAGRACWAVAGTLCGGGIPSGTFARKMETCIECDFYHCVRNEEKDLKTHHELLIAIRRQ